MLLACPGKNNKFNVAGWPKTTEQIVTCNNNKFTAQNNKKYAFNKLICQSYPYHTAELTGKSCDNDNIEIVSGFTVKNKFLKQFTVCHDEDSMDTIWTHFKMSSHIKGYQKNFPRPSFSEGIFYNATKKKINDLYSRTQQQKTFQFLLGAEGGNLIESNSDYYLARGHLVAKADFVYGIQHRSTFYYVNTAPQWQTFNGGNWNDLEANVRKYAGLKNMDLDVYTGTYGVSTLPDENNEQQELYLLAEGDVRGIAIPKYFWKVVHDPVSKKGIAFIGANNPYQFDEENDVFCDNICDEISWVTWKPDDIVLGYGFCCEVDDFRKTVGYFPKFTVTGLLK